MAIAGSLAWGVELSDITKIVRRSQGSDLSGSGIPKEEIDAWETSWEDPRTENTYHFRAAFTAPRLRSSQKAAYVRAGTIPYRITGDLFEYRVYRGRKTSRRMTGTARIVILDSDGKKIASQSVSLAKLCPT